MRLDETCHLAETIMCDKLKTQACGAFVLGTNLVDSDKCQFGRPLPPD